MDATVTDSVIESPVVVWVLVAVAVAIAIATAVPKILGPLSQAWIDFVDARRRLAIEADDADIREKNRQIRFLEEERKNLEIYLRTMENYAWTAYYKCREAGIEVQPPPARYARYEKLEGMNNGM